MATNAVWVKVEEATLGQKLREVSANLAEGEVTIDLSSVRRIGTDSLRALEELAKAVREKKAKVSLRGVNVDVYKVLKVAKVTEPFSFAD
jgi:anti-anti-sigma regulatory factor